MKAILMSIKPQWVSKILNREKTIEVRKHFPKDYVGWVYIYCTKAQGLGLYCLDYNGNRVAYYEDRGLDLQYAKQLNGKVVARFWCDKVEEIYNDSDEYYECYYQTDTLAMKDLCEQSCLDYNELNDYLCEEQGKAIHITNLEIFDKPKEVSEFFVFSHIADGVDACNKPKQFKILKHITRPPQSWCYIEI